MASPNEPKTRFDLVSPGIGRLSGAIVMLVLGLITLGVGVALDVDLMRQMGLTMVLMALFLGGMGAYRVYTGIGARTRSIKCPQCGEVNQILQDVTSFPCFKCEKSLKIGPRKA